MRGCGCQATIRTRGGSGAKVHPLTAQTPVIALPDGPLFTAFLCFTALCYATRRVQDDTLALKREGQIARSYFQTKIRFLKQRSDFFQKAEIMWKTNKQTKPKRSAQISGASVWHQRKCTKFKITQSTSHCNTLQHIGWATHRILRTVDALHEVKEYCLLISDHFSER